MHPLRMPISIKAGSKMIDQLRRFARKHPAFRAVLSPGIYAYHAIFSKKSRWQDEVLDALGELLVDDPVIRVDEFLGTFAFAAKGHLFARIVKTKTYEPKIVELCKRYLDRGRDVIDVGANIGLFTVFFAKSLSHGRVLSVEPTPRALQRLRRNIDLNGVSDRIDIYEGVALDRKTTVQIKTIKDKEEYSTLGELKHRSVQHEACTFEEVVGNTVDELVAERSLNPGFMKVDVEGTEHLVFGGARKILEKNRPVIVSELCDFLLTQNGSSASDTMRLILSHEYDIFDPGNPESPLRPDHSGDIICFPREMHVDGSDLVTS